MKTAPLAALLTGCLLLAGCGDQPAPEAPPVAETPTPAESPPQGPPAPAEPGPLAKQLQEIAQGFATQATPEMIEAFQQANEEIAASGALEDAVRVGGKAADFALRDQAGNEVSLSALLDDGPVVLAFYRGKW